jgi:CrcB protein
MLFRQFLLVGAGGALGSMARYGVSFVMSKFLQETYKFGATFTINIIGSLIIGILFGLTARHPAMKEGSYLFLASGFCGGFTTFSSFALENVKLMNGGQSFLAFAYIGLSVVVGLVLCRLGIWLVHV